MNRVYNFSAGPSMLPLTVLEKAASELVCYGESGMYDAERSYFGVSTCMFFNNAENVTLENVTFSHAGGFSVQIGNCKNVVLENIEFEKCFVPMGMDMHVWEYR